MHLLPTARLSPAGCLRPQPFARPVWRRTQPASSTRFHRSVRPPMGKGRNRRPAAGELIFIDPDIADHLGAYRQHRARRKARPGCASPADAENGARLVHVHAPWSAADNRPPRARRCELRRRARKDEVLRRPEARGFGQAANRRCSTRPLRLRNRKTVHQESRRSCRS